MTEIFDLKDVFKRIKLDLDETLKEYNEDEILIELNTYVYQYLTNGYRLFGDNFEQEYVPNLYISHGAVEKLAESNKITSKLFGVHCRPAQIDYDYDIKIIKRL